MIQISMMALVTPIKIAKHKNISFETIEKYPFINCVMILQIWEENLQMGITE